MKYYVLFGPPGAGKGTFAKLLVENKGYYHISTGDLLRKEIAAGSPLGREAKSLIEKGNLVPDEVVCGMIRSEFGSNPGVRGFLLDGFPRTVAQAEALDKILSDMGAELTRVVSIYITDEEVRRRIKGRALVENRADDADDEIISTR
ncbi:MAG: nucleoside monophosphate kinase, partial [Bacteroidales bacterium]|nr:nucleoside monophosphate kinase [Bacteroidales bacterium]